MRHRLRQVFSLLVVVGSLILLWTLDGEGFVSSQVSDSTAWTAMLACTFAYMTLLAIPFVPGMELGWLLMGAFGVPGIIAAWVGTVAGLTLGFGLACHFGKGRWVGTLLERRDAFLSQSGAELNPAMRLLQRGVTWQQSHPYLFLLVGLNVPGNLVLGGGGGIAWLSALTGGVHWLRFILVAALATCVVPLLLLSGLRV